MNGKIKNIILLIFTSNYSTKNKSNSKISLIFYPGFGFSILSSQFSVIQFTSSVCPIYTDLTVLPRRSLGGCVATITATRGVRSSTRRWTIPYLLSWFSAGRCRRLMSRRKVRIWRNAVILPVRSNRRWRSNGGVTAEMFHQGWYRWVARKLVGRMLGGFSRRWKFACLDGLVTMPSDLGVRIPP